MNTMQRSITVEVRADGTTKVEAHNFKGVGCADATKEIEVVLAGNASNVDKRKKPDYFATNPTRHGIKS